MADQAVGEKTQLIGMISKSFPTTVAAAVCYPRGNNLAVDVYWAGDSRVYLLNEDGLAQLSEDDLGGIDAMENLTMDGILTNSISLSKDFEIHSTQIFLQKPGVVFTATDGCFGYFSTPMEFEFLLLRTMLAADTVEQWENDLKEQIGAAAGDDYSIRGIIYGFKSFDVLKRSFLGYAKQFHKRYIENLEWMTYEEKLRSWQQYKHTYYRYCDSRGSSKHAAR